jgi:hypothetical protein
MKIIGDEKSRDTVPLSLSRLGLSRFSRSMSDLSWFSHESSWVSHCHCSSWVSHCRCRLCRHGFFLLVGVFNIKTQYLHEQKRRLDLLYISRPDDFNFCFVFAKLVEFSVSVTVYTWPTFLFPEHSIVFLLAACPPPPAIST